MPHCSVKNCPFDKNGKCVENQLPNCPNLKPDVVTEAPALGELTKLPSTQPSPPPTHEPVYSGRKITAAEAEPIFQSNPLVIVLGGVIESGKTTLLARIFEMFQAGEITRYGFMKSRTLVEFDKLGWHATMECGATTPTTEHTTRAEHNLFLHLRVRAHKNLRPPIDLLFADIPGEIFPEAVAEESVCRDIQALRRADHLLLFLDCAVLCHSANRHDHRGKVFNFLSRALQTGQVGQQTVVHLVFSKCDLITPGNVTDYVEVTDKAFRRQFAPRVGGLQSWRVAARPQPTAQATLTTIDDLFYTLTTRATPHASLTIKAPARSTLSRDFTQFGL